jgi:hypothetical protein
MSRILSVCGNLPTYRGRPPGRDGSKNVAFTESPGDSGYSSHEDVSPTRPPMRTWRTMPIFDGPGSAHGSEDHHDDNSPRSLYAYNKESPHDGPNLRATSNPGPLPRTPGSKLRSFFTLHPDENGQLQPPPRRESPHSRRPDRFVPLRDAMSTPTERFHMGRRVNTLSPSERLVRHGAASRDPFVVSRLPATEGSTYTGEPELPSGPQLTSFREHPAFTSL